jgi:FKBP-type peptidyl-prolyl cis-trans isomerase
VSGGLASLVVACCTLAALFAAGRRAGGRSSARRLAGVSCAVVAMLAGCGGGEADPAADSSGSATAQRTTPTVSAAEQARADAREQRRAQIELERTFAPNPWKEPGATPPHPRPLERLIVRELERGRGPPLSGDENVWVNFTKTYWRSGHKFLAAWGPLRADYFSLLAQAAGVRRGMIGMRPGGRRTIAMPERIADVHEEHGAAMESANIDVVLRGVVRLPAE